MKRFIAIFAIVAMLCSFCTVGAFAEEADGFWIAVGEGENAEEHWVTGIIDEQHPTCTEAGYIRYACQTCLDEGKENAFHDVAIPANGHKVSYAPESDAQWGGVYVAPTCTEAGQAYAYCTVCGEELGLRELAALGHDFTGEWHEDVAATCKTEGVGHYDCTRCGEAGPDEKIEIDENAHVYTEWNVEEEATCCKEGLLTRVCVLCSHAEYKTAETLDHEYAIVDMQLIDCETIEVTFACACGDSYTEEINGDFHNYKAISNSADCQNDDEVTLECTYCHATKTEPSKALGHLWGEYTLSETYVLNGEEYGLYIAECQRPGCIAHNQVVQLLVEEAPEPDEPVEEIIENVYALSTANIAVDANGVSGTGSIILVEGNQEIGELYARVAVVYENEAGEQILVVNAAQVKADLSFKVPSVKAPFGYSVKTVCVVGVDNDAAVDGAWADYAVTAPAVL